ncbi:MAG: DNA-binding response regulator [Acidobacteriota bacterium]
MNETDTAPVRVLLVDDHAIVREGLRALLEEEGGFAVAGEAADGERAVAAARELSPDVILMDLLMPGVDGLEALRRIRAADPQARVLVLTSAQDDRAVREAIDAGAVGFLFKDVSRRDLVRAVRDAAVGRPTLHPEAQRVLMKRPERSPLDELTPRERTVLELIAQGRSNRQIALRLELTEGTVKGYVSTILDKLGVQDRTGAALFAVRHGLGKS